MAGLKEITVLEVTNLTGRQIFGETAISACVDVQKEIYEVMKERNGCLEEVVKSEGVSKGCLVVFGDIFEDILCKKGLFFPLSERGQGSSLEGV